MGRAQVRAGTVSWCHAQAFVPRRPGETACLELDGPAGPLEVVVDLPKADVPVQPIVAIVCHPLSTEGGTLHNKVVTMTATTLRELGIATVRFNFRSVGASAGTFDGGVGEQDDLKAVAAGCAASARTTGCGWPVSASVRSCR